MKKLILPFVIIMLSVLPLSAINVGVAWRDNTSIAVMSAVFEGGGEYFELSPYSTPLIDSSLKAPLTSEEAELLKSVHSWPEELSEELGEIDLVIVGGGVDISPSLYGREADANEMYNRAEDISDWLLISYALENHIPLFCICRGMQMLGVLTGSELVMDIPSAAEEHNLDSAALHRDGGKYTHHTVSLLPFPSRLSMLLEGMEDALLPSRHHQTLRSVVLSPLTVSALNLEGYPVIEAVETEEGFVIGVQFHPEWPLEAYWDGAEIMESFTYEDSVLFFSRLFSMV